MKLIKSEIYRGYKIEIFKQGNEFFYKLITKELRLSGSFCDTKNTALVKARREGMQLATLELLMIEFERWERKGLISEDEFELLAECL